MFFPLSKALWSMAGAATWVAVLLGAALAARRRRTLALALLLVAGATMGSLTLPPVANALGRAAASSGRTTLQPGAEYDAAIALGGNPLRLLAAADVVRSGRARHLLYSGALSPTEIGDLTAQVVARGVPRDRILFEVRSRNTHENAVESARVAAAQGWRSLLLVTSASHVERAVGCFHRVGLSPDVLAVQDTRPLRHLWPRLVALERSMGVLHEIAGRVVYRVVGYSD